MTCPECGKEMSAAQYQWPCAERYDGVSEWHCACGVRKQDPPYQLEGIQVVIAEAVESALAEIARLTSIIESIDELVNDGDGMITIDKEIDKEDATRFTVTAWGDWNADSGGEYRSASWQDGILDAIKAKHDAAEATGGEK